MNSKKFTFAFFVLVLFVFNACKDSHPNRFKKSKSKPFFQGKYLVDNVYFPQDTLKLKKFRPADSTAKRKLLIEFRNDSIFLSNYYFGPWYGKWFCDFYNAPVKFENNQLKINALLINKHCCLNYYVWRTIEYHFKNVSGDTITLIKTLDTSNCFEISSFEDNVSIENGDFYLK